MKICYTCKKEKEESSFSISQLKNSDYRCKECVKKKNKEWYLKNKEKVKEKSKKITSHIKELGCSIEELKLYLEKQFQIGMTWENWNNTGWHIDHIKPLSKFNLTDINQIKEACHYTNLQPLWAKDNILKGNKESNYGI